MAVDEASRLGMYEAFKEVVGADHATTLMEHLPDGGWRELATKSDVALLRTDVGRVETGLRKDMSQLEESLRKDMSQLEESLRKDMSQLEESLRQDMEVLDARFGNTLHTELDLLQRHLLDMHRNLMFGFIATLIAFAGLVLGLT